MGALGRLFRETVWNPAKKKALGRQYSEKFEETDFDKAEKDIAEDNLSVAIGSISLTKDAVRQYSQQKASGILHFSQVKGPGNSEIFEELKKNTQFSKRLTEVLNTDEQTEALNKAYDEYERKIDILQKESEEIGKKYGAGDLSRALQDVQKEATDVIKQQQALEKESLTGMFEDHAIAQNLELNNNLRSEDERNQFRDNMLAELKTNHEQALAELDKKFVNDRLQLASSAQKQANTRRFIAHLVTHNNKMREQFTAAKNKKIKEAMNEQNLTEASNSDGLEISSGPLTLEDIAADGDKLTLYTESGNAIHWTKEKKEDGKEVNVFTLHTDWTKRGWKSMFKRLTNPLVDMEAEIRTMAEAVKATGSKTIDFKLKFKDPKLAKKRAGEAIRSALKAGFSPKDISLNVNGKEVKYDPEQKMNSFKDYLSAEEMRYYEQAQATEKKVPAIKRATVNGGVNYLRNKLRTIRTEAANAEADDLAETAGAASSQSSVPTLGSSDNGNPAA